MGCQVLMTLKISKVRPKFPRVLPFAIGQTFKLQFVLVIKKQPCCTVPSSRMSICLTHWTREPHIGVNVFVIIGQRNSLAPSRRQSISWTNDDFSEKKPRNNLRWNICLILRISLRKIEMKWSSVFSWQNSPGLNVLTVLITGWFRDTTISSIRRRLGQADGVGDHNTLWTNGRHEIQVSSKILKLPFFCIHPKWRTFKPLYFIGNV